MTFSVFVDAKIMTDLINQQSSLSIITKNGSRSTSVVRYLSRMIVHPMNIQCLYINQNNILQQFILQNNIYEKTRFILKQHFP